MQRTGIFVVVGTILCLGAVLCAANPSTPPQPPVWGGNSSTAGWSAVTTKAELASNGTMQSWKACELCVVRVLVVLPWRGCGQSRVFMGVLPARVFSRSVLLCTDVVFLQLLARHLPVQ